QPDSCQLWPPMRQARQSTGTQLILGHSRPCVVFSGKQAFASICNSSDSKVNGFIGSNGRYVRRFCRSTAPECSSKRVQPVMFSLEAPDIKRGIAALKYIKDYQQFIKGTRIADGCEKGATRPLAVLREARCARSLLHITGFKKIPRRELICGVSDGWRNVCELVIPLSRSRIYLEMANSWWTGAAFPPSCRRCHSRLAVSFATFQKIRHRIPAGL